MKKINKRGQAGIEYLIIVGFVSFAVLSVLLLSNYYSGLTKDKLRLNQADSFFIQVINSAETVFFSGEPSRVTISLYLPSGVESILINNELIVVTLRSSTGNNVKVYKSKVPIQGSITNNEGTKTLTVSAKSDHVEISQ